MRSLETAFVLSSTVLVVASSTNATRPCFYPSGDLSGDQPCDPDAPVSVCCSSPAECLSNGLCREPDSDHVNTSYARGSCTDHSWKSSFCPQFCFAYKFTGEQVWECGNTGGYSSPATYCCETEHSEGSRCCSTPSALFELGAATVVLPSAFTSSASTTTSKSSLSSSMPSRTRSVSIARLFRFNHTMLSMKSPATRLITPHLAPSTPSLSPSLTSSLATSTLSSSRGKTPLVSLIGAILGGTAFLGMAIGGVWIWNKNFRTTSQTGGPEWSKPELSANAGLSLPLHRDRIYEIRGGIKDAPQLPAPARYELTGDDGAREMPTSD